MSETFEISGSSPAHSVVSENGKKYYYLNVQQQPTPPAQITAEVTKTGPLNLEVHANRFEQSGPLHYYGENMVVRNARVMFNNVDILPDGRYFCCVCRRPYKTHATLSAHLRGSHLRQESPCPEDNCNHVSVTENERRKHQKWHDKIKYSSVTREQLLQRMSRKIMEPAIIEPRTPRENVLREQIVRNTTEVPGMKLEEDKRGKLKYACTQCDQSFNNPYRATRHMELHGNSPKRCFYCGEIRKGTMDLHVHYMRFHKNEGIRTVSCKVCNRAFTSTSLFRNHANQPECELACQNALIRQDIYYGELPPGTVIDSVSLSRLNFFRKRQEEREQMGGATRQETVLRHQQMHNYESTSDATAAPSPSDIFDESSNTLIQTEFGLKNFAEFKTSRAVKRGIDQDPFEASKAKRNSSMTDHRRDLDEHQHPTTTTTTTQSQQQNIQWPSDYIHPPPSYGYDPLIGTYPDYQPMQQFNAFPPFPQYYPPFTFYSQPEVQSAEKPEEVPAEKVPNNGSYRLGSTSGIESDLLVNQQGDVVFEELDKLDFVMPDNNNADNDVADLEGMFNF